MKKLVLFFILLFGTINIAYCQDNETTELYNTIQSLEILDSLNTIQIESQSYKIKLYQEQAVQDSLLLLNKDREIRIANQEADIYKKYANLYKPKWYENKHLWFFLGSGTTILTGWVFINVTN